MQLLNMGKMQNLELPKMHETSGVQHKLLETIPAKHDRRR
jgi:hypothetical protein